MHAASGALLAVMFFAAADARADSETRNVQPFDSIVASSAVSLKIKIGPVQTVRIDGDRDFVRRLTTDSKDGTLSIGGDHGEIEIIHGDHKASVTVTLPVLTVLKIKGAADVEIDGLDGGDLTLDVNGAARVKAQGRLTRLNATLAGVGDAHLGDVPVDDAVVTLDGLGRVEVQPHKSLVATVNGLGMIRYVGQPDRVESHINGLGSIERGANDED
jgi:hypothetical protein